MSSVSGAAVAIEKIIDPGTCSFQRSIGRRDVGCQFDNSPFGFRALVYGNPDAGLVHHFALAHGGAAAGAISQILWGRFAGRRIPYGRGRNCRRPGSRRAGDLIANSTRSSARDAAGCLSIERKLMVRERRSFPSRFTGKRRPSASSRRGGCTRSRVLRGWEARRRGM